MSKKAAESVFIIIVFSFASRFLAFIRELLIAAKYGSGVETDTFFIALSAITLFTTMITTSIQTTMIPVLVSIEKEEGKEGKIRHINNFLNLLLFFSLILIVIGGFTAPWIIKLLASGFRGEQYKLAVLMMRIGLPAIFFATIQGVFRGALQSEMKFAESASSDLPYSMVYIFFLLIFAEKFTIVPLMIAAVLATASRIIIQIPSLRKIGYRYKFVFDPKDIYVKQILRLIPPVLMSTTINDINNIVDKSMASNLKEGSISALQYANRLLVIVRGTFVAAVNTVMYPIFSNAVGEEDYSRLKRTIIKGILIILLITIPASVGMIMLSKLIVKVFFQRGAFGPIATSMTSGALVFYSIGLSAVSIKIMVNNVFYSLQDTKTPMINSFFDLLINIALNLLLIGFMGHQGLALASSTSAIVTLIYLIYKLRERLGSFGFKHLALTSSKIALASGIMGLVVYLLNKNFSIYFIGNRVLEIICLLAIVIVGVLIYLPILFLLRVEEFSWLMRELKNKVRPQKDKT